jgi:hypothetical protein
VHLPEAQASIPETYEIAAAITGYFGYRARITMLDLKELFRVGWRALAIGLTVLSFSVIIGQTVVVNLAPRPVGRVIEESLLIFGWVANWKPIEIFLYEWWPIVRRRNLYQRLAAAQVELKPYRRDERGRTLAFDPCPYRKHRTNSAQSRALEKKGLGENEWRFYTVGTVHSLVRRIRPLLKICAAPTGRRIL